MAKLTVFAALFAALIAVASASAHTTVVTTTVDDHENQAGTCRREIQQFRMRHCMQWMLGGRGPYEADSFIRSAVANPGRYEEEHLEECCDDLRRVSADCRCDAIRRMMRRMQEEYGMEEEMEEMKQMAQSLPRRCRMRYPTECRIRALLA